MRDSSHYLRHLAHCEATLPLWSSIEVEVVGRYSRQLAADDLCGRQTTQCGRKIACARGRAESASRRSLGRILARKMAVGEGAWERELPHEGNHQGNLTKLTRTRQAITPWASE